MELKKETRFQKSNIQRNQGKFEGGNPRPIRDVRMTDSDKGMRERIRRRVGKEGKRDGKDGVGLEKGYRKSKKQ